MTENEPDDGSERDADESADEQNQYGGQTEGEDAVEQTERRDAGESEGEDQPDESA